MTSAHLNRRTLVMGACAAALAVLAYILLWWNRFTGLSDGLFVMHAQQVLAGRVPYRDFYLPIPPLTVLKTAVLVKIFGPVMVIPRFLAVMERACLSAALFCWLASAFRLRDALLGSVVSMIVFCGDFADQLCSYHYDSVLFAVSAGICATWLLGESTARRRLAALCCGLSCGLAFMTKQTTGAGVTLALLALILLCYEPGPAQASRFSIAGAFWLGWAFPVGAIAGWLYRAGALSVAVETVLGKGTASKGPLGVVLARPIRGPLLDGVCTEAWLAALLTFVAGWLVLRDSGARPRIPPAVSNLLILVCLGPATCLLFVQFFVNIQPFGMFLGLFASFAVSACLLVKRCAGPLDTAGKRLWVFSATSFAVAYMLSLSWAAYQPMAVPAIAFLICFALARADKTRLRSALRPAITAAAVLLAVAAAAMKLALPYGWVSWQEPPVWTATAVPHLPELRGMRLSPSTLDVVEAASQAIQNYCGPGEPLFAYPYLPLLHILSHRPPATFSYLPWYDITPDYVAEQDARSLLSQPPCAIAYLDLPLGTTAQNERVFRNRAGSGQRELVRVMAALAKSYRVLYRGSPPGGLPLTVYGRPSAASSAAAP